MGFGVGLGVAFGVAFGLGFGVGDGADVAPGRVDGVGATMGGVDTSGAATARGVAIARGAFEVTPFDGSAAEQDANARANIPTHEDRSNVRLMWFRSRSMNHLTMSPAAHR